MSAPLAPCSDGFHVSWLDLLLAVVGEGCKVAKLQFEALEHKADLRLKSVVKFSHIDADIRLCGRIQLVIGSFFSVG